MLTITCQCKIHPTSVGPSLRHLQMCSQCDYKSYKSTVDKNLMIKLINYRVQNEKEKAK